MSRKAISFLFLFAIIFSYGSLQAQKKKKNLRPKTSAEDIITEDTLRALIARGAWQFPITKMWDDALLAAKYSHRPVLAFNVDYVDPNSIYVRDKILRDPEIMIYLTKNFELALNDFSVDPPASVGFDSLRNLGARLDGLEKGYNIVSRPTGIILTSDGTEIERVSDLQHYSGHQLITVLKEYLAGKNTVDALRKEYWSDSKNLDKHKQYLDRLMQRFDYDSILYHLTLLSTDPNYGQTPEVMKEAAAEYAYLRFKQEGNVSVLKNWLSSLDMHSDSAVIFAGLKDLLEYYQTKKKIDSISVYYDHIIKFSGDRDPDLLNNFAWDLASYSKRYDSALSFVNEAIAKNNKNPEYYDTRALIDYYRKEYDLAIEDARLGLKYGKADKEYFKDRVEFYEKEKKRIAAEGPNPLPSKEK